MEQYINNDNFSEEVMTSSMKSANEIPSLPIGSIVLLNNGVKRVMIYGRKVRSLDDGQVYDYLGCLYPEGALDNNHVFVFNRDQIKLVYFIGFQDMEELVYRKRFRENVND